MEQGFVLSIVIPVLNEQSTLPELLKRVGKVMDDISGGPHELLFVDDGSSDRTVAILEEAIRGDPRIRLVSLSRNFGHQAAISAGLDHARGDAVVIMDGDLQDAPEEIPRFLGLYREGYDVVYARRLRRKEGFLLRATYFLFYRILAALADIQIPLDAGDFGLISRRVVEVLKATPERTRYLRGLRTWAGFRQIGIDVERSARFAGQAKYRTGQLFKLALDGIFAFSTVPLRAASGLGAFAVLSSFGFLLYSLWAKLIAHDPPRGFTALIFVIVFLSGVQLLFLGIIGEYIGRIYQETKQRPLYVVQRVVERLPSAADQRSG